MCVSLSVQISESLLNHILNDVVLLKGHVSKKTERADLYYAFFSFLSAPKYKVLLVVPLLSTDELEKSN